MRHLAILFLALSGCAAQVQVGPAGPDPDPIFTESGSVPPNEILITRPSDAGLLTTVATAPAVFLHKTEVGRCEVGKPLLLRVPDGRWVVRLRTPAGEVEQRVTLEGGQSVEMTCGVEGALAPRPVLSAPF